jgi:hypothetical protein
LLENMVALCNECPSSIKSPLQEAHAEITAMIRKAKLGKKL